MRKNPSSILLVPMFLVLAACSAKQEGADFGSLFQTNPPASSHCPANYAPISIEGAGTVTSFDEVLANGDLRYAVAETYFQIAESGQVIAQGHVVDASGTSPTWKCSNSSPRLPGYSAEVNMNLPVTIDRTGTGFDSVVHGYALELFDGSPGMMLMTNTSGERTPISPAQLLGLQDVTEYRVYRLADGSVEIRLRREAALSATGVAMTTAFVRYTSAPRVGSGQ